MAESIEEIRSFVAQHVAEGFDSAEEIIDSAIECFEVEENEELCRAIAGFTAERMAEHLRSQSQWPKPTDCDRLDWAFEELERSGIVARQNFSCCGNCGHSEIWAEIKQAKEEHPVEGYVFYHMQDTESAVEGGYLYLAYGSVEEGEEALTAVGRKLVLALECAGLRTEWNGQADTRIRIVDLDWKRRR
ncbi:MAG: DUF6891 domain-containing protein [Gemmataceae bacterium]